MNRYDVFISYRRDGGKEKARPLKSELEKNGYKVFLDFDDLTDSVFDKRIMDAIDSAPIFLIILSKDSLLRCKNEDDWVRKEIEYAESKKKHFVPVNPDKEFDGFPKDVPDNIKQCLGQHQFSSIDYEQLFKVSFEKMLRERIEPIISKLRENERNNKGALIRIETDLDCRVLRFKEEIALAKAGYITEIRLPKGKHRLTFEGIENKTDSYSLVYEVKDIEYEDYIEVSLLEEYKVRKAEEERLEREKSKNNSTKINNHEYVDLGLPSGLKWATCNVGASKPEEYGDYFAWGEITTKKEYTEENSVTDGERMRDISGNAQCDAARANWGGTWRMPTESECQELIDECTWQWTTQGGKRGYKVIGPNGNSIFLPAAGYRDGSSLRGEGFYGSYWSSTPDGDYDGAYGLYFDSDEEFVGYNIRGDGHAVRPITE